MYRRVAKKYLASIRVDPRMVEDLVEALMREALENRYLRKLDDEDPIGEGPLAHKEIHLEHVKGPEVTVRVVLIGKKNPPARGKFIRTEDGWGTYGKIKVWIPAEWPKLNLRDDGFKRRVVDTLTEEIAHAKDVIQELQYDPDVATENPEAYYNDPAEIQAKIPKIVNQAKKWIPDFQNIWDDPRKVLRTAIKGTEEWKKMKEHLTEKNRKKVLKEVYKQLSEDYDDL